MTNDAEFQTPVIALFVNFYSFLGISPKLSPLEVSSFIGKYGQIRWTNVLIIVWNFTLDSLTLWALNSLDPFSLIFISTRCHQANAIFTTFVGICVHYVHPLVYALDSLYLLLVGHRIARLLDAPPFRASGGFGSNRRQAVIAFLAIFTVNNFLFWEFYKVAYIFKSLDEGGGKPEVQEFSAVGSQWQRVFVVVAIYNVTVFNFLNCYVLHYSQQCTYASLKKIQRRLLTVCDAKKMSAAEVDEVEKEMMRQIRALALLNWKLNEAMSLPHLIFTFLNVFNAILTICMMAICRVNAALVLHGTLTFLYLLYLLSLNRVIVNLVRSILRTLRHRYLQSNSLSSLVLTPQVLAVQHRPLQITAMDLYVGYFPVKLFHLIRLEVAFVFQTGFFMLSYIVFITQTN